MEEVLLTAKALTYAQRMQRILIKNGIQAKIIRPDVEQTKRSCAYAVVVSEMYLPEAVDMLRYNNLFPVRVLVRGYDGYRELNI